MKKVTVILMLMLSAMSVTSFAQTASPDFFAGKWEVLIVGIPNGDAKLVTNLLRKDGKLTGEFKDPSGQNPEPILITNVIEEADKLTLFFTAQGTDVNLDLAKVDDDHLKGSILNGMFDASAVRIKD